MNIILPTPLAVQPAAAVHEAGPQMQPPTARAPHTSGDGQFHHLYLQRLVRRHYEENGELDRLAESFGGEVTDMIIERHGSRVTRRFRVHFPLSGDIVRLTDDNGRIEVA